ncbi:hypothetical protein BGZ81_011319 [Podila clonocystis]|nr:hypothetical protein BGZ81_011319 [Podila clonocystis]
MRTPNRRSTQPSIPPSQPSFSSSRLSLLAFLILALSTFSTAGASITCALPAGGTYKAGDSIILDWGSDGTMPVVTDIASISGTLYCNSGSKIADVSIPNLTGPFNWTVPGVGNATTIGGNQGVCLMNAFHIEYSGEAWGFLHAIKSPWGPVRCGTITIAPADNGTLTTTTTTMTSTSTTTTSATPTETSSSEDKDGGISTVVIVVIAVVAAVILTLSIVGLVWYLRKQKKRRLANALGPWSLESNNNLHINNAQHHSRFSKVSTIDPNNIDDDEPHGSPSASNNRPAMSAIGGAAAGFAIKPQPSVPGSNRTSRQQQQEYYDEGDFANYGYQQQQQILNQGQGGFNNSGYHLPGGYTDIGGGNGVIYQNPNTSNGRVDVVAEDDYYNPYYAHRQSLQQQQQYQQLQMLGLNASNPSFYSQSNASNASGVPRPYSGERFSQHVPPEQFQANGGNGAPGYFPPPPPKSNARGAVGMTSLPTGSTLSLSNNSPKRGPQGANVMAEMGSREAAADGGGPEKVLVKDEEANKAMLSDDEDVETTPLTTGTTVTSVTSATAAIFDEKAKESS